jgi:hypothetical protein
MWDLQGKARQHDTGRIYFCHWLDIAVALRAVAGCMTTVFIA